MQLTWDGIFLLEQTALYFPSKEPGPDVQQTHTHAQLRTTLLHAEGHSQDEGLAPRLLLDNYGRKNNNNVMISIWRNHLEK